MGKGITTRLKQNRSLLNGAMFSMFSFINRGFTFFLLMILANYIAPAEYGYLSLFNTVIMVLSYFMAMSTEGYLSVAYFREKDGVRQTISAVSATTLVVAAVSLLIVLLGGQALGTALNLPLETLYLAVGIAFFTIYVNLNLDIYRLREKVATYGILSCSNALLNFVVSILFVETLLLGWQGRVYAQFMCCVLYGVLGIAYFARHRSFTMPDWGHWKTMLVWGLPLIPHHATAFIRQGCDRYIINYSHSIDDVGLFSFAINIANVIIMVGIGFNQSNSVDIYKVLGNETLTADEKLRRLKRQRMLILKVYAAATVLITAGGYFTLPYILPNYAGSMNYFLILSLWGFLQCMYFLYTNYLFFYRKTKEIMYITFGTSLLHLVLSLLLTRYSLYLTCCIYVLVQLVILVLIKRKVRGVLNANFLVEGSAA